MNQWETKVVDQFIPELSSLWVVSDADAVARNENILAQLNQKGFEVVVFEDPIEFRFEYENADRHQKGQSLIIIYEPDEQGRNKLPSDILANARSVDLNLNQIFPHFDRDVIRNVPVSHWNTIWSQSQRIHQSRNYGETAELILRVCYRFVYDIIDDETQLVRSLIDLHLGNEPLPNELANYVASEMKNKGFAQNWELNEFLSFPAEFWRFLQACWVGFLKRNGVTFDSNQVLLKGDNASIDFDETSLKYYVDNLLSEGFLQHLECEGSYEGNWWSIGIGNIDKPPAEKIEKTQSLILKHIPESGDGIEAWKRFGHEYGKQVSLLFQNYSREELSGFWTEVWDKVDGAFQNWLRNAYPTFHNLAGTSPAMVHQIPRFLDVERRKSKKVALIVLDGLSIAGWHTLRPNILEVLSEKQSMTETTTFAWIPSLTPVSRQSIFAGSPPHHFQDTLKRTDKDGSRWRQYWTTNTALLDKYIEHLRIDGEPADLGDFNELFGRPNPVIGVTINKPDDIMHGTTMGWKGWHHQLSLWSKEQILSKIIKKLLEENFSIGITADHGNLEAIGIGKVRDGTLAERRGERVRIYNDKVLRDNAASKLGEKAWYDDSLPFVQNHWAIFPEGRSAFTNKGETIVAHGGSSIDELMVPWVTIKNKETAI